MSKLTEAERQEAVDFFKSVQSRMGAAFEQLDGAARMEWKPWSRAEGGGGTIGLLRGEVVEKAGVNTSEVYGERYPALEGDYKDLPFTAAGVSTITHMMNPHAPIGHMNVRLITAGDHFWFGGGADLTPCFEYADDTQDFHNELKRACDGLAPDAYERYTRWCDEYFYIGHRQSRRGVGGIFFDYLKGDFATLFPFVQATAEAYLAVFPRILARRKDMAYSPAEKEQQLFWRGRYAEFNLVYDRGTKFGLLTGGNIEAIFVSLPPVVKW